LTENIVGEKWRIWWDWYIEWKKEDGIDRLPLDDGWLHTVIRFERAAKTWFDTLIFNRGDWIALTEDGSRFRLYAESVFWLTFSECWEPRDMGYERRDARTSELAN
jgi:hypothetical protein